MMALLADMPLRLLPLDFLWITGPVAALMILAEMIGYALRGRRPAASSGRATIAVAIGGPAIIAAIVAMVRWPPSALLIIGAMLIVWVAHSYGRTTSPVSRPRRLLLVGLRTLIVLLLLAYLLRPTLSYVRYHDEKAVLLILYDVSASMSIADAGAGGRTPRADALARALQTHEKKVDALTRAFDVHHRLFDERLGVEVSHPARSLALPTGETTAIGRAIREFVQEFHGRKIGGVIVFTDGAENASPPGQAMDVAADLARLKVPIWPVAVGRDTPPTDQPTAVIKELRLARRIAAFNVLTVHAVYELVNLGEEPVKVELVFGAGEEARVADTQVITAAKGQTSETIATELKVMPTAAGFHAVTVRVAEDARSRAGLPLASEFSRKTDYVQVVDDMLGVLYVEGKFRTEAQYIIAALAGSDLLRLNRQFILTTAALDGGARSFWPKSVAEWQKYHVIVLGDVEASAFTAEELRTIRSMVQDMGKGLLLIGGRNAFGGGGWPDTPLAELAPFDLRLAVGHVAESFRMTAAAEHLSHPLMQLHEDPSVNAKLWAELPPMQGANRFPDARAILADRPGAMVLASVPNGPPVMVAQSSGKGRVLAVAVDTTWRWRLHLDEGAELHNKFWRQAVLWLAQRQGNVWVKCEQPRYRLTVVRGADGTEHRSVRQKIVVTAGITDQAGKPIGPQGRPRLTLIRPDGQADESIDLASQAGGDVFRIELPRSPSEPGNYRLVLEGTADGKDVRAETNFIVEQIDLELAPPRLANYTLLRQMAAAGADAGSEFYTLNQIETLLDRFDASSHLIRRESVETTDLGDDWRWPLLVAVFAGLLVEWMVRKRSSLV